MPLAGAYNELAANYALDHPAPLLCIGRRTPPRLIAVACLRRHVKRIENGSEKRSAKAPSVTITRHKAVHCSRDGIIDHLLSKKISLSRSSDAVDHRCYYSQSRGTIVHRVKHLYYYIRISRNHRQSFDSRILRSICIKIGIFSILIN